MKGANWSKKVQAWVGDMPDADVRSAIDRLARLDDVVRVAVMPDVHLAKDVCIGVVVATRSWLLPQAVGGDIGCGVSAMRFDCGVDAIEDGNSAYRVLDELQMRVPSNRHPRAQMRAALPDTLGESLLSAPQLERLKLRDGLVQFGTLGRGNHFLEFQADEEDRLWIMIHSGSRAMGQAIKDWHIKGAERLAGGLLAIRSDTSEGQAYLNDMNWCLHYATENRRAMIEAVCDLMWNLFRVRRAEGSLLECHHNHVVAGEHKGAAVWIHRKGAISAQDGETGIIPGSMASDSLHVSGRGCADALCSSSHGAGRQMSRSEARKMVSAKELDRQMAGVWFDRQKLTQLTDEAPSAYKDIGRVMRAQKTLTKIIRRLRPLLSYKGT